MRKFTAILFGALVGLNFIAASVGAETFEAIPSDGAALLQDGAGIARVAVRFDLTGFPTGPGVLISEAYLEWNAGTLNGTLIKFWVENVTGAWSKSNVESGNSVLQLGDSLDEWEITPQAEARAEGFVRLKIDAALIEWLKDPGNNFGVVIATANLSPEALGTFQKEGHLVVRYSLVKPPLAPDSTSVPPLSGTEP